jgi:FkbM family methyltransferase
MVEVPRPDMKDPSSSSGCCPSDPDQPGEENRGLSLISPSHRMFKLLVEPSQAAKYADESYQSYTSDLFCNILNDDTIFLDICAGDGFFSLLAATSRPLCRVISFLADATNYEMFRLSVASNGLKNVDMYKLATVNADQEASLERLQASRAQQNMPNEPSSGLIKETDTDGICELLRNTGRHPVVIRIAAGSCGMIVSDELAASVSGLVDVRLIVEFEPDAFAIAGSQPTALISKICSAGFDVYLIDDEYHLAYKITDINVGRWKRCMRRRKSANLLCIRKQRSLSVCFFSHATGLHGAERSLVELASELLRDYGAICTVIVPGQGPMLTKLKDVGAGFCVTSYDWWCDGIKAPALVVLWRLLRSLANVVRCVDNTMTLINPDVVVSNTLVIPWGAISSALIATPHAWFVREYGERDFHYRFWLPFNVVLHFIEASSELILTNSEALRAALFGRTQNRKFATSYCHIEVGSVQGVPGKQNYYKQEGSLKLIIVGRIESAKGQKDALAAVAELRSRKVDVELVLLGNMESGYANDLQSYCAAESLGDFVTFVPFREDPHEEIALADVVLMCSTNEAFGRVTQEAMLLGKPVIGTNAGGTPEIIQDGYTGLLYEPGDYRSLADKIQFFAEDRKKIAEFGENGRQFARKKFSKEAYGGMIFAALLKVTRVYRPSLLVNMLKHARPIISLAVQSAFQFCVVLRKAVGRK